LVNTPRTRKLLERQALDISHNRIEAGADHGEVGHRDSSVWVIKLLVLEPRVRNQIIAALPWQISGPLPQR
jgi:hypothetical protein